MVYDNFSALSSASFHPAVCQVKPTERGGTLFGFHHTWGHTEVVWIICLTFIYSTSIYSTSTMCRALSDWHKMSVKHNLQQPNSHLSYNNLSLLPTSIILLAILLFHHLSFFRVRIHKISYLPSRLWALMTSLDMLICGYIWAGGPLSHDHSMCLWFPLQSSFMKEVRVSCYWKLRLRITLKMQFLRAGVHENKFGTFSPLKKLGVCENSYH